MIIVCFLQTLWKIVKITSRSIVYDSNKKKNEGRFIRVMNHPEDRINLKNALF